MSQPRAPQMPEGREAILVAAAVLNRNGFGEVGDMLEDIAAGKWTLTNAVRDLRGRRNEPSASVPWSVIPALIREGKIYGLRVGRVDCKHLTVDDYRWVTGCLGLPDPDEVDLLGVEAS